MILRKFVLVINYRTLLLPVLRCMYLQSVVFTENAETLKVTFPFCFERLDFNFSQTKINPGVSFYTWLSQWAFQFSFWWITHVKCLMQKYNDYYIRKNHVFTNWNIELYKEGLWRDLNNFLKLILAAPVDVWLLLCISVVTAIIFSSLSSTGVFVCEAFPRPHKV